MQPEPMRHEMHHHREHHRPIREAFHDFDVEKVAALTSTDIDTLAHDTRLIRNHRKIEAIVDNAGRMLDLERQPGGFADYLRSH